MVNHTQNAKITHLFRPLNLGLIVLLMYVLRHALLLPMLQWISEMVHLPITTQISSNWFFLLVLSVTLIAAGGYILNDLRDTETDAVNHGKNPVGILISEKNTLLLYQVTTILGVLLGFIIGLKLDNYNLGILHLTAAVSLWFYANYFKKKFITGNLIVAFLVALVPLTTGIFEVTQLQIFYFNKVTEFTDFNFNFIAYWFIGYTLFAFILTFIREILKDMEDVKGDRQIGATTLPIVWGIKNTKAIVTILYLGTMLLLWHVIRTYLTDQLSLGFMIIIDVCILLSITQIWTNKKFLLSPSNWNKLISVMGIFYLIGVGIMMTNKTILI